MVTMKAKQMVSKFDLDVLKQPLTFNIIITIIPVGRVMYIYTALTGVEREEGLGRIVRAAADVASHDYTPVDVLAAERAVGVDRVAN